MEENAVLAAIKGRRSIIRFKREPVTEEQLGTILEAGRWAPSFANSQPWEFIVVRDSESLEELNGLVQRIAVARRGHVALSASGIGDAPVAVVVTVNPWHDPRHHLEAGVAAAQNMALATHSLGLAPIGPGSTAPAAGGEPRRGGSSSFCIFPKSTAWSPSCRSASRPTRTRANGGSSMSWSTTSVTEEMRDEIPLPAVRDALLLR